MKAKNAAVCHVQAIQLMRQLPPRPPIALVLMRPLRLARHTRPSAKPLAM